MAKLSQIKLGSTTYDIGAAWGNISGKPTEFTPSSHTHSYLPLSGGTLTGTVNSSGNMNLYGSNAYFSLGTSSSSNKCYFQTYNATTPGVDDANLKAGFGFGWSNSLIIDKSGNVTIPGDLIVSGGDITGNVATATKLQTARTIKIGESAQNFDGSANLTYAPFGMRLTKAEYGAYDNMNVVADTGDALGMANLTSTDTTISPGGSTGWHHYINMTWSDAKQNNNSTTNEWCTQIANKCGTTDLWVRSRSGGSITDGAAWVAPWTRILTGSNYTNVLDGRYVNTTGDTMTGLLVITTNGKSTTLGCQNNSYSHYSTNADIGHWFNKNTYVQGNIYAGSSYNKLVLTEENYSNYAAAKNHNHDSAYLKLSGGTLIGLLNAHGGISLNSSTAQASGAPEYILGIKAFAEGGNVIWQNRANVSVGYADSAGTCTSLSTNAGSTTKAIYFTGGKPAQCNDTINHNVSGYSASLAYPTQITTDANIDGFLEANRFKVGTWNSTSSPGVGNGIILSGGWTSTSYGFQIAIDDDPTYFLALRQKNTNGWQAWKRIPMADGTGASGTWNITAAASNKVNNIRTIGGSAMNHAQSLSAEFEANKSTLPRNSLVSYYSSAYGNGSFYQGYFLSGYDTTPYGGFFVCHYNTPYYVGISYGSFSQYQLWKSGDAVTGAVWNDYAECRESDCEEFGYVLMETGNDSLTKTVERLSHFAGISSDTWGFSQGETEKAKTHIAVAGRVLAYPYQDRNNYKPGDCVCAAPGGTVDIMTREEVINWPDRIVGTVSSVPDYEEWGGGNDRDPVKVNGRIWIKVR